MSIRFESVFVSVFEFVSPWRGFRDRKMIDGSVRGYMRGVCHHAQINEVCA